MATPRSVLADLPFLIAKPTPGIRRFNDQTLRAVGAKPLAPGMATVLHAVDELGEGTVSRLVEATHLPNGTLTGLLDTLEQNKYIRRVPNPADGRSWIVKLTPLGRRLCEKLRVRHRLVLEVFGEALSPSESSELARLLETLSTRLQAYRTENRRRTPAKPRAPRPL